MLDFNYYSPTEIVFGKDAEYNVGKLIKKHGGSKVFVVYGSGSAVKSGLLGRVENCLKKENLDYRLSGGVVANPLLSTAQRMSDEAVSFGADFILALGGGSVIDTAKAVAHSVAFPEYKVWDFWKDKSVLTRSTPIGVILTISAAGSELSDSAVLTADISETVTKRGLTTDFNRPAFAVMNPELTMTLPVYQIAAGVTDIFMHTSERYFAAYFGNHLTDEIAEGLFRNIIKYGVRGVKEPENYEAMSEIMWSGSVSHSGLTGLGAKGDTSRDGDWACHQLGMAVSALYNSTHGATLSAVWGAWAKYVMNENVGRFAEFSRKVYGVNKTDDTACALIGIEKTEEFFKEIGMPVTLTELLGHRPDDKELEELSFNCSYSKTRTIGSFKILSYDDMLNIYKNCR